MRVLTLHVDEATADAVAAQVALLPVKDVVHSSKVVDFKGADDILAPLSSLAACIATAFASEAEAHFDGILAFGAGADLLISLLALLEAAEASVAAKEEAANSLPAGPAKVDARKKAKAAEVQAARRSRALRVRFVVLIGPTHGCVSQLSVDPALAAQSLNALDAGVTQASSLGTVEGGAVADAASEGESELGAVFAKPLGTRTKALFTFGKANADQGRMLAERHFGAAHFVITHGADDDMPSKDDAANLLKMANFMRVGLPDELIAGCAAWYEHRRLGWLAVKVTRVDYQGVADGGATYCITAPELDGEVETVRNRLRLTKPDGE